MQNRLRQNYVIILWLTDWLINWSIDWLSEYSFQCRAVHSVLLLAFCSYYSLIVPCHISDFNVNFWRFFFWEVSRRSPYWGGATDHPKSHRPRVPALRVSRCSFAESSAPPAPSNACRNSQHWRTWHWTHEAATSKTWSMHACLLNAVVLIWTHAVN